MIYWKWRKFELSAEELTYNFSKLLQTMNTVTVRDKGLLLFLGKFQRMRKLSALTKFSYLPAKFGQKIRIQEMLRSRWNVPHRWAIKIRSLWSKKLLTKVMTPACLTHNLPYK